MPGEEVAFDRITQVYREEGKRRTLVALEPDFWERVRAYLRRLEDDLTAEAAANPSSPKATLLRDELRKAQKARDQIYTYRERKLVTMACAAAAGASQDLKALTRMEHELFQRVLAQLREGRGEALEGRPLGAPPAATQAAPAAAPPPTLAREPREASILEILEDVPTFAGPSGTYRLKRGDLVTLPDALAKVLLDKGKARAIRFPLA